MNKDDFLDLMRIPRWRLRDNAVNTTVDYWAALPVLVLQAAELPHFISIIEANKPNAIEIELANAIAKACGIAQENHLILLYSPSDQTVELRIPAANEVATTHLLLPQAGEGACPRESEEARRAEEGHEHTLQNFLVKSSASGFIVFFGDKLSENINKKMQLPANNGNWWTVATVTLTQLAQQPAIKKQLWQSLQLGMSK